MRSLMAMALVSLSLAVFVFGQEALTNASIEKMTKAGLGEDVIVSVVQNQPAHFDLTPETLVTLKGEGVSEKVLAAMAAKNGTTAGVAKPTPNDYDDLDVGVYYRSGDGSWALIASEIVNWKSGGAFKSIASHGIVKGDINGHLNGKESATRLATPLEILIKTPEEMGATDYQLVHLHVNSDNREFRTRTGGVFHAEGGASRDTVEFESTRIAKHVYTVTVKDNLAPGEYAFLPPGLTNSTASGSTGKAYTFQFLE